MKAKNFLVFASILLAIALMATTTPITPVSQTTAGIYTLTYHSKVIVHKNGEFVGETENLLTNLGRQIIATKLFFGNQTQVRWIAVGGNTTSMTAGDTILANEAGGGLNRTNGQCTPILSAVGVQNVTCSRVFTADATFQVNSTGLFNQTSGVAGENTGFFAEAPFAHVTLQSGDTLNITWNVWVA